MTDTEPSPTDGGSGADAQDATTASNAETSISAMAATPAGEPSETLVQDGDRVVDPGPPAARDSVETGFDLELVKRVLETALLVADGPLSVLELRRLFNDELGADALRRVLETLRADWEGRGIELTHVASGWRFRAHPDLQQYLDRLRPDKPPRYSRAVMETLAIIAYRQPVTRGEIEAVRGVTVSGALVKTLEQRGWVEAVGHKEVPGRPALYATTSQFLDDLNLKSLGDLPPLEDLGSLVEAMPQLPLDEPASGQDGEVPMLQAPADGADAAAEAGGEASGEQGQAQDQPGEAAAPDGAAHVGDLAPVQASADVPAASADVARPSGDAG
ncbi:MAG: SMC-Scp complex subunit ScpB [bacterium]|jgi:segregation and condensation protein B|nr:SMC-Scp complex subunit ScpB [Betaproteobacteria bacterium]